MACRQTRGRAGGNHPQPRRPRGRLHRRHRHGREPDRRGRTVPDAGPRGRRLDAGAGPIAPAGHRRRPDLRQRHRLARSRPDAGAQRFRGIPAAFRPSGRPGGPHGQRAGKRRYPA
ncbi:hypothetical protein G6F65_022666 [Rhizopus arrhizus]|nr:hypothetical protein G6F65_022666 [Rhizopus arrhizus]